MVIVEREVVLPGEDACRYNCAGNLFLFPTIMLYMRMLAVNRDRLRLFSVGLFASALIAFQSGVAAATLTVAPVADTFISEHFTAPNGGGVDMVIGTQGAFAFLAVNRGLIKFDVSAIPANATVGSVTLQLTVSRAPTMATPNDFHLHRLLREWSEAESTWTLRAPPDQNWDAPGAASGTDYSTTVSANALIATPAAYTFASTPEMVADVTAWIVNASANHGWLVKTADESTSPSARRFVSREAPMGVPQLTVEYTVSEALRITSAGINSGQFCLQFRAKAGKTYVVERQERLGSGQWTQVATLPPAQTDGPVTVCDPVGANTNFYRVAEF